MPQRIVARRGKQIEANMAKMRCYEYHVWTIDTVKTAKKFQAMGVMSITTNDPGYLRKHIIP